MKINSNKIQKEMIDYFKSQKNIENMKINKQKKLLVVVDKKKKKSNIKIKKDFKERLAILCMKHKNYQIKSALDFKEKYNKCILKKNVKSLSIPYQLSEDSNVPCIMLINKLNNLVIKNNIYKLNAIEINSFNIEEYPYFTLERDSNRTFINTSKIKNYFENSNLDKNLKTRYIVSDSLLKKFIKNGGWKNNTSFINSFLTKSATLRNKSSDFFELIDELFSRLDYDNEVTKAVKAGIEISVDFKESGGPDGIFNKLNNLDIDYKDKGKNYHKSGKIIAKIIGGGLGKEFLGWDGWKFGIDPEDNRMYMDNSVQGKKFLWCGATVAFLLQNSVSSSVRKNFKSTKSLFHAFNYNKDICVYKRNLNQDNILVKKGKVLPGDVITITSNDPNETEGSSNKKMGDHICYVKDVNYFKKSGNYYIKSVSTYEGNTSLNRKNTVASKTREIEKIAVAYRFSDKNKKSVEKYEIVEKYFPKETSTDYTIIYALVFTGRLKSVKNLDKYFNKVFNCTKSFKRKYFTKKRNKLIPKKILLSKINNIKNDFNV